MAVADIKELAGERLEGIISELARTYHSPAHLRQNQAQALALPEVVKFREDYAFLVNQAQQLSHQLEMAILTDLWRTSSGRWEKHQEVKIMCYAAGHGVPKVVATASLPEGMEPSRHRFSHKDLTSSFHLERIEKGRIVCDKHPDTPANAIVSGSVSRVFPPLKMDPQATVDCIVTELAKRHFKNNGNHGKFERFKQEIRTALDVIFRVGERYGGLFDTLYEGLEHIRYRAVTSPFIACNAELDNLPPSIKRMIDYKNIAGIRSREQCALKLRSTGFFMDLEEIAARNIPSPLVVMKERVKGNESLAEKLVVARHWGAVLEGYDTGRLQAHFKRLGLPTPRKPGPEPPHVEDYVSLDVLVHDDLITADLFDFKSRSFMLSTEERDRLIPKMYDIFCQLAEIGERGYCRLEAPKDRKGVKRKVRMPPDKEKPLFASESKTTQNGLVFWLDPKIGTFDDYATWPRASGYMAIHAIVGSNIPGLEHGRVELHIKPNVIRNAEVHSPNEDHHAYKEQRAGMLHFLRHTGVVSPMEWEAVKLLFKPENAPYRETNIALTKL